MLPTDNAARKALPLWTGVVQYFPDALLAVAAVSKAGNDQHNPGEPLHWAREKSTDQMNTAARHMLDHSTGTVRDTDGTWHLAKAAWRLLAELQLAIEATGGDVFAAKPRPAHDGEIGCASVGRGGKRGVKWSCDRPAGHPGNHMAWDDYESGKLYAGGEWA